MKKLIITIMLLFVGGANANDYFDDSFVYVGNGAEFRARIMKVDAILTYRNNDEFKARVGLIYRFKEGANYHFGLGGGFTYTGQRFPAIPKGSPNEFEGYSAITEEQLFPYIQIEAAWGYFLTELFYSDNTFKAYRFRLKEAKSPPEQDVYEDRFDFVNGPGFGAFVGFRIPF